MCLPQQRQAQRESTLRVKDVLNCGYVVEHLADIATVVSAAWLDLEEHQVRQRCLSAFDPAGQYRLPAQQGPGQQMRVGEGPSGSGE